MIVRAQIRMTALQLSVDPATLVAPMPREAAPSDADAASIDDPDPASGFTTWERSADGARVGRSHLRLGGMWCAGCAGTVERALRAQPGVLAADASYAAQRATIV